MTTKKCAFKDCGAFVSPSHPCLETFYALPKDPERCKLWLQLGACPDEIPYTMRYFCSKHFDETKYVAHNQRRKQLLSTAVPWPYTRTSPQKEIVPEDVDYQCVESTIDDNDEDESTIERLHEEPVSDDVVNDLTNISDSIDDALQSFEYHDENGVNEFTIAFPTTKKSLKRKAEFSSKRSDSQQPGPSKHIVSKRATSTVVAAREDDAKELKLADELEETKLLESSNITTFIFRGQEYIQMPKDEYLLEKAALIQKIKTYEDILKNVKHLVEGC